MPDQGRWTETQAHLCNGLRRANTDLHNDTRNLKNILLREGSLAPWSTQRGLPHVDIHTRTQTHLSRATAEGHADSEV